MGEGEAKDVDPGLDQVFEDLVALRGRSDGGYDSRAPHDVPFGFQQVYEGTLSLPVASSARRPRAARTACSAHRHHDVGAVDVDHAQVHAVARRESSALRMTSRGGAVEHDLAAVEQDQPVGELSGQREVVQGRDAP